MIQYILCTLSKMKNTHKVDKKILHKNVENVENQSKLQCIQCEKRYTRKSNLKRHQKYAHSPVRHESPDQEQIENACNKHVKANSICESDLNIFLYKIVKHLLSMDRLKRIKSVPK